MTGPVNRSSVVGMTQDFPGPSLVPCSPSSDGPRARQPAGRGRRGPAGPRVLPERAVSEPSRETRPHSNPGHPGDRDQGRRVFVVCENGVAVERPNQLTHLPRPGAVPVAERLRARLAEVNAASRSRAGGWL